MFSETMMVKGTFSLTIEFKDEIMPFTRQVYSDWNAITVVSGS